MIEETAVERMGSKRDLICLAILAGLIGLFFFDVLFLGRTLFLRDITRYYFPAKFILREMALAGQFPSWNPFFGGGQPMAANPEYAVFYPLHLLLLLPDFVYAFQLLIVLHVYIGAASMYLFLRSWNCLPETALIGGITFSLGGIMVSLLNLLPYLFLFAWTPLAFLFVRRFLKYRRRRDFAAAGLVLALQLLTPEPTTILQIWFLLGAYAAYNGWKEGRWRGAFADLGRAALLGLVVVGAGAVQILPALDHARDSVRARPFDYRLASAWSLPPVRVAELMFPSFLGHPFSHGSPRYWGSGLYRPKPVPFLFSIYLGLLTLALAIAGGVRRVRGWSLVLVICVISFVLALGGHLPLFRWLYDLKIASAVRYPEKFALMGLFAVLVFSMKTLDSFLRGDEAVASTLRQVVVFLAAVTVIGTLLSLSPVWGDWIGRVSHVATGAQMRYLIDISRVDWILALVRAGILLVLLRSISGRPSARRLGALVAFVFIDLAMVATDVTPRMPRSFFSEPSLAQSIKSERAGYRVFPEADWYDYYGLSRSARLYSSSGDGSYWTVQHGLLPHSPANWGVSTVLDRDYDKTALLPTVDLVDSYWKVKDRVGDARRGLFMSMSNARWREEFRDFGSEVARVHGRPELVEPIALIEEATNPRYYFADQVVSIDGVEAFTRHLVERSWSPRVAFVQAPGMATTAHGQVLSAREWPSGSELRVTTGGAAFLVASVTAHKYWKAWMDGRPVPLIRTNVGFQGLVVPGGTHVIRFQYDNWLMTFAAGLSVLSFSWLLVLARISHRPSSRGSGERPGSETRGVFATRHS